MLPINLNIRDVVLEHSWHVDLRKDNGKTHEINLCQREQVIKRTSGKVPFENTINKQVWKGGQRRSWHGNDRADLSTSTISNNDEFPADFSHVDSKLVSWMCRVMFKVVVVDVQ